MCVSVCVCVCVCLSVCVCVCVCSCVCVCVRADAVKVHRLTSVFVQLKASLGLRLQFGDHGGRVYLQLDSQWRGSTLGLCGTYNGNLRDDFL